jgi:molecular chaperone GrpE
MSEARAGGAAATTAGGNAQAPLAAVAAEVEALRRERDEYLDALKRLKAEFDNYRKRVAREQQQLAARAHERLVRELVPVLDDLERALEAAAEHEEAKLEEGVRLVHRALADALAKEGLAEIAAVGAFDPHTQEALLSQPSEADEGTVIQVLQKGYSLGDRVLRPARVVVSAGAPGPTAAPEDGEGS